MHSRRGFTLVEVLFVVIIAAGIMAFAMPAYKRMQERANYNAALGTLLDINNAVNSLKRDLKSSTGVSVSFPAGANSVQYGDSTWGEGMDLTLPEEVTKGTIAWNEYVAGQSGVNLTKAFIWALHQFKYLKPIQNTKGYDFYILNSKASGFLSKCSMEKAGKKGTACMYVSGEGRTPNNLTGCYLGAIVYPDGSITRIKGTKSGGCGTN